MSAVAARVIARSFLSFRRNSELGSNYDMCVHAARALIVCARRVYIVRLFLVVNSIQSEQFVAGAHSSGLCVFFFVCEPSTNAYYVYLYGVDAAIGILRQFHCPSHSYAYRWQESESPFYHFTHRSFSPIFIHKVFLFVVFVRLLPVKKKTVELGERLS